MNKVKPLFTSPPNTLQKYFEFRLHIFKNYLNA
jgi:hypothetical protein